ncbi:MAG: AMP-binding protein [Hominimerdicola sp.]
MNIYLEMRKAAMSHYSKTAISILDSEGIVTEFTYAKTLQLTDRFANKLTEIGIQAGDRVGIASEACPYWNMAFMACAKINATAVLIDSSLPKKELAALVKKAQLSCLIASPKVINEIGILENVPILQLFRQLELAEGSCKQPDRSGMAGDEKIAVIIFSSGTTKTASGIMHTHESQIKSCRMVCDCNGIDDSDVFLGILPNSHIYGLFAQVIAPMILGASVGFIQSLNAKGLTGGFKEFKPTIIPGVPKVYELLKTQIVKQVNSKKSSSVLFKTMFPVAFKMRKIFGINMGKKLFGKIHDAFGGRTKILCSAGSPMTQETCDFYYGAGFNILNNYGATETSIPTIGNTIKNITTNSCGRAYPDVKLKIDHSGEILIKSPYMMLGYFNDEEATRQAFTADGWFHSGDLGNFNKHKNILILGRCKENIVLATGKKVAPDDIEAAYLNIENADELVVCGVPAGDGSYDEVHAFVVAEKAFHEDIRKKLMGISSGLNQAMKLSAIHFVNEIPRTAIGKPKRYLLKKMVMEDSIDQFNSQKEDKKKPHTDSTDIAQLVKNAVAKIGNVSPDEVKMSTKFLQEYTIDSLSAIELAIEIESFSGVKVDDVLTKDMTVGRLISLVLNPNRIRKTTVKSMIYPLDKKKIDYRIYRFFRNLTRTVYEVKVHNDHYLPEENGYIICANHVSNFDFLFLTQNFKRDRFAKFCCMAKKELFTNGFFHKIIIRAGGMVPVDRGGQVKESMQALRTKLSEKWGVLVHPEGTRSKTGEMGKFKSGAAILAIETDSPIVPAYIKGGHEIFPPKQKMPKLFDWKHMKKYKVAVYYGKPIYPNGETPEQLMEKVREAVLALKEQADAEKSSKRKKFKS